MNNPIVTCSAGPEGMICVANYGAPFASFGTHIGSSTDHSNSGFGGSHSSPSSHESLSLPSSSPPSSFGMNFDRSSVGGRGDFFDRSAPHSSNYGSSNAAQSYSSRSHRSEPGASYAGSSAKTSASGSKSISKSFGNFVMALGDKVESIGDRVQNFGDKWADRFLGLIDPNYPKDSDPPKQEYASETSAEHNTREAQISARLRADERQQLWINDLYGQLVETMASVENGENNLHDLQDAANKGRSDSRAFWRLLDRTRMTAARAKEDAREVARAANFGVDYAVSQPTKNDFNSLARDGKSVWLRANDLQRDIEDLKNDLAKQGAPNLSSVPTSQSALRPPAPASRNSEQSYRPMPPAPRYSESAHRETAPAHRYADTGYRSSDRRSDDDSCSRRPAALPRGLGGNLGLQVRQLERDIQRFDPGFRYPTIEAHRPGAGARYTERDVRALQQILHQHILQSGERHMPGSDVLAPRQAQQQPIETREPRTTEPMPGRASANRVLHERYVDGLREVMQRPHVQDKTLSRLMDKLYRPGAQIGSGSTAAAVRHERTTGNQVGGKLHTQKAQESVRALERWLSANPYASSRDRAAAENVLIDLLNALEGR